MDEKRISSCATNNQNSRKKPNSTKIFALESTPLSVYNEARKSRHLIEKNDIQKEDPTLKNPPLSQNRKTNIVESKKYYNYYDPISPRFSTESFINKTYNTNMDSSLTHAIKAGTERQSFQKIMENLASRTKTPPKQRSEHFSSPPSPNPDGAWTKISSREVSNPDHPKEVEFPLTFPKDSTGYGSSLEGEYNIKHHKPTSPTDTAVTITVKLQPNMSVSYPTFIRAMLACMKVADPDAQILPKDQSPSNTLPTLIHESEISGPAAPPNGIKGVRSPNSVPYNRKF